MKINSYAIWLVLMMVLAVPVLAAPTGPGWSHTDLSDLLLETLPVSESQSYGGWSASAVSLAAAVGSGSGNSADAVTPEIRALAQGLHNDPVRIYAYVKNNIAYVHYHGAKRGAVMTLLEGSGNDFDQCALLVALLRAAGYTARYRYGYTRLFYKQADGNDLVHWLGVSPTAFNHLTWQEA